jgi:hypothetical protein
MFVRAEIRRGGFCQQFLLHTINVKSNPPCLTDNPHDVAKIEPVLPTAIWCDGQDAHPTRDCPVVRKTLGWG